MSKFLDFIKKRWYLPVIILLIAGFIVYRNIKTKAASEKKDSYIIKKSDIKDVLSLSGQIDASEKATLKFQTSGRLAWVGVKEGDYVKKYQTVAVLDQRDVKNRLDKYLNTYATSRNSFDQTKEDNKDKQYDLSESVRNSVKRVLENNQYSLNNAVLDVEYQHLSVEYASLFSPIEGVVTHMDVKYPGTNITPAGAAIDIVNPATIYFSATADQTDVVKLIDDMVGKISFDAYPDDSFNGHLYYIAFTPKEGETGTVYELRFKLDQDAISSNLKMGMTGDINILIKEYKDVLTAPTVFIKKDSKGNYVTEKKNGKNAKNYIEIGEEVNGKTIIKNGISAGTVIYD